MSSSQSKKKNTIFTVAYLAFILWLFVVIVCSLILFSLITDLDSTYKARFQVPLFAGFLTLGSFLLTLKSFVIIQFKKELFEKKYYLDDHFAQYGEFNGKFYYEPLNNLAQLLLVAVIVSISTSFSQLTLGFIPCNFVAAFCLGLAVATLILVACVWYFVRKNVIEMFSWWEKDIDNLNKTTKNTQN